MNETITVGELTFTICRSAKRSTVGLTVERDGSLRLHAPLDCPVEQIEQVATAKQLWVHTKLAEKRLLAQPIVKKLFVTGEGFPFLGRSYRLRLIDLPQSAKSKTANSVLRLHQGRFLLWREEQPRARKHFIAWYTLRARSRIIQCTERLVQRLEVTPQAVDVRDLGFRWGSCSQNGKLYFHWRTILLPPRIIEYIVTHELIHIHEPHHDRAFWQRVERALPDYNVRKQWLAERGGSFGLG